MPKPTKKRASIIPPRKPLWGGPYVEGVSQSLLGRFLACRERFRLLVIEGLKEKEDFSHQIEYGQLWHCCEEYYARHEDWKNPLRKHGIELCEKWPDNRAEINKWYEICKVQFPIYVAHWSKHPDRTKSKALFQEEVFKVPYELPSGRIVKLRGKFDSIDLIGDSVYLHENKSKGNFNKERVMGEIGFNLQVLLYLIAMEEFLKEHKIKNKIAGVRYNIVRRPLSDWRGKFNITQRKGRKTKVGIVGAESQDQFYQRLGQLIKDNPDHFFFRIKAEISKQDIERFKLECLNPILEQLCDWWDWVTSNPDPFVQDRARHANNHAHFRFPFGVYNPIAEGRQGDYWDYLRTGNSSKLEKVSSLFGELVTV